MKKNRLIRFGRGNHESATSTPVPRVPSTTTATLYRTCAHLPNTFCTMRCADDFIHTLHVLCSVVHNPCAAPCTYCGYRSGREVRYKKNPSHPSP